MGQNSHRINVGYIVTLFQTIYYGREKKSNFAVGKSDKHYLFRLLRSISMLINNIDSVYP